MFQSFTGTSRRPRQVNLSGRPSNPFASSSTPGSGSHTAIASAQQDRVHRQQQRDRAQASSRIQRVWRGHSCRQKTLETWRQSWDFQEENIPQKGAYTSPEESMQQLNRLLLFYRPTTDAKRLAWYGMRQMATSEAKQCDGRAWQNAYLRIARACIANLKARTGVDEELDRMIFMILADAARRSMFNAKDAVNYYETLTTIRDVPSAPLQDALLAPLETSPEAYVGLALLLTQALDTTMLALLRSAVDPERLSSSLNRLPEKKILDIRPRLWLLGNVIYLTEKSKTIALTEAVARLLGSLADDVDFEAKPFDLSNEKYDKDMLVKMSNGMPLNRFLHDQIGSLIDQESIRNLLVRDSASNQENAQLLAEYALTLLRCFPRKADDIRMWLYLGPTRSSSELPATLYFWNAARQSSVFGRIRDDPRAAVGLVSISYPSARLKDDWTLILVFLELYTFVLKIMDDEEFMGTSTQAGRKSAIPVGYVGELVTFLKNLGFSLYFESTLIDDNHENKPRDAGTSGLSRHFGGSSLPEPTKDDKTKRPATLVGLPGLTRDYLKGVVTGLLRAIYERDSRRHFLPKDHWLMTSRFDMGQFIPSVVEEEEKRHNFTDVEEDEEEEESDEDDWNDRRGNNRGFSNSVRSPGARDRAQRKMFQKRYMETVAPRLETLQNMPFFIPFTTRVEIFREFVSLDKKKRRDGSVDPDIWRHRMMAQGVHVPDTRRVIMPTLTRELRRGASGPRSGNNHSAMNDNQSSGPNRLSYGSESASQTDELNSRSGPSAFARMLDQTFLAQSQGGRASRVRDRLERQHAKIRRKHEFSDAFEQFYDIGSDIKDPIQITFVDEFDIAEAGIDGGGVTKEFLTSVITQAFSATDPNVENSFFVENERHLLYPNPTVTEDLQAVWTDMGFKANQPEVRREMKSLLQQYEFLGRIIGKCLYEEILVDVNFAGFFLKKWALTGGSSSAPMESGYRANINDLRELDEDLYRGLLTVKNASPDQVEEFGLTFTVDDAVGAEDNKHVVEHELMPGGANIAVTAENRLIYINRMARYRLQAQSASQTNAFLKGISSIIQPSWLSMFNQSELQTLIGGVSADIDVEDLRSNTHYGGVYVIGDDGQEHPSIQLFWNVMSSLPDVERRKVLKFVTSTPRGPLLGFKQLNPPFSIRDSGGDEGRFPTTSTCVNLLKLPIYKTETALREKLLAAVNSGAGFDLS